MADKIKKGRFSDFFVGTPAYNNDKDYAAYAALTAPLNMFFLICLVLHTGYIIMFSLNRILILQIFDFVSVILYATFVILLKYFKGSWFPCTLLTVGELFLHQICAVALFGLEPGFQYLMIPLMFLMVFISKRGRMIKFLRRAVMILSAFTFIFLVVYFNDYIPPYELGQQNNTVLLIVNCITSFLATAIYAGRVYISTDTKRSQLDESVDEKIARIERMQNQMVISFANIIEARDGSTGKHVLRTSEYVQALVFELQRRGNYSETLTAKYAKNTILSAPLHDIGKITVPDSILQVFVLQECSVFYQPQLLGDLVLRFLEEAGILLLAHLVEDFLEVAKAVVLYHHECWNGAGYPYGIKGFDIPLCARIMTIADVFDALAAKRVYKKAMPISEVFDIIRSERGKKFDPVVTDAFLGIQDQIASIAQSNAD